MPLIPSELFDLSKVQDVSMAGRGGNERGIGLLLPRWRRASAPLYDFDVTHRGTRFRLEVKKQKNLQWFDSGKYYRLSDADRDILIMFANHDGQRIHTILVARMGTFVEWLCANRRADGWTDDVMSVAAQFKGQYPSLQFKAQAQITTIYRESPDLFQCLYSKSL